jgi:hypothetical protein
MLDADRVLGLDEVDAADYGLTRADLAVALVEEDGRRFELAVGSEMPLGSKRAVRRGDDGEILLCSGAFAEQMETDVDGWRSRDVVEVVEDDLASIRIEAGKDRIVAVRENRKWTLEEPVADLADAEQMRSLVSELNGLRITEFLADEVIDGSFDPTALEYRIELRRLDDDQPLTLELAAPVEGEATVVCRRNGRDVFRIPDGIRARLGKAPVLWRSKSVWPFQSFNVGKLEIASGEREAVLDRIDGMWRVGEDEVDQAAVRRRLNALADLEALDHDLVTPPTEVMGSVILVLDDEGGAEGLTYTFYAPIEDGGHAVVTVSTRRNVMGVDAALAESIVGNLESLLPTVTESAGHDEERSAE